MNNGMDTKTYKNTKQRLKQLWKLETNSGITDTNPIKINSIL